MAGTLFQIYFFLDRPREYFPLCTSDSSWITMQMFRMFRWPYPRSNRPLCVFLESFVTPGARLIVRWTHNKHVSPRLRVLSMESLMDSIHQPKTQSRSPVPESVPDTSNSNRNIGQRDIRFLFRIAAILDGRSLARSSSPSSVHGNSLYLYIVFFSVFIFFLLLFAWPRLGCAFWSLFTASDKRQAWQCPLKPLGCLLLLLQCCSLTNFN